MDCARVFFFLSRDSYVNWKISWAEKTILALSKKICANVLIVNLEKFRWLKWDSNPWPLRWWCSTLTKWAMKSLSWELFNLLDSFVPVKNILQPLKHFLCSNCSIIVCNNVSVDFYQGWLSNSVFGLIS